MIIIIMTITHTHTPNWFQWFSMMMTTYSLTERFILTTQSINDHVQLDSFSMKKKRRWRWRWWPISSIYPMIIIIIFTNFSGCVCVCSCVQVCIYFDDDDDDVLCNNLMFRSFRSCMHQSSIYMVVICFNV